MILNRPWLSAAVSVLIIRPPLRPLLVDNAGLSLSLFGVMSSSLPGKTGSGPATPLHPICPPERRSIDLLLKAGRKSSMAQSTVRYFQRPYR
jgi:hypothetical protein